MAERVHTPPPSTVPNSTISQDESPRHQSSGLVAKFSSSANPDISRKYLAMELKDRIEFNNVNVLRVICVGNEDPGIPRDDDLACMATLSGDIEYTNSVGTLFEVIKTGGKEFDMYGPLLQLINAITRCSPDAPLPAAANGHLRQYVSQSNSDPAAQPFQQYLPKRKPDILLLDEDATSRGLLNSRRTRWKDVASLIEVKRNLEDSPYASSESGVPDVIAQVTDYTRLQLSTRPLQLFAVSLIIWADMFCLIYVDRSGVVLSPQYPYLNQHGQVTILFVQVIRRLTFLIPITQLGMDPTVAIGPRPPSPKDYPVYDLTVTGTTAPGTAYLTANDGPSWSSISLLGRGSSVWLVKRKVSPDSPPVVLKNAWRKKNRQTESDIYTRMQALGKHRSIAGFVEGGDAYFDPLGPEEAPLPIDTNTIRTWHSLPSPKDNLSLHRLVLDSPGTALWHYTTTNEFALCLKDLIAGFRFLAEHGIRHRDISAGNLFLSQIKESPSRGFIADFEFASIPQSQGDMEPKEAGPAMTGTAQFMAMQILRGIVNGMNVVYQPRHDHESFVWVTLYSVYSHLVKADKSAPYHAALKAEFHNIFAESSLDQILDKRRLALPLQQGTFQTDENLKALATALRSQSDRTLYHLVEGFLRGVGDQLNFDSRQQAANLSVDISEYNALVLKRTVVTAEGVELQLDNLEIVVDLAIKRSSGN